jgi:hypothetical protein
VIPVSCGQRWRSRRDHSIVVTVLGRSECGLWSIMAPTDRAEELISEGRLGSDYQPAAAARSR